MAWFVIAFVLWAFFHSVTAALVSKAAVRDWLGAQTYAGWYRLVYNVVAFVTFVPVLVLMVTAVPDTLLWQIPALLSWLARLLQLLGVVGLGIALWQTDVWSFAGVRQVMAYLRGEAAAVDGEQRLVVDGPYAWVRHPLYFFSLVVLGATPEMRLNWFLLALLSTLYFWLGSIYEERKLRARFGTDVDN